MVSRNDLFQDLLTTISNRKLEMRKFSEAMQRCQGFYILVPKIMRRYANLFTEAR